MSSPADPLQARILQLQQQRDEQWNRLRDITEEQLDNFRPGRFIQNALMGIREQTEIKSDILHAGVNLAATSIVKAIVGKSKNKPLKKWLQVVLVYALSALVVRYKDQLIEAGSHWLDQLKARFQPEPGPESDEVTEGEKVAVEESK